MIVIYNFIIIQLFIQLVSLISHKEMNYLMVIIPHGVSLIVITEMDL